MSLLGVGYFKHDAEVRGYDVGIVRELAGRLGCQYEIIEMNRSHIFQSLERGDFIDLPTSTSKTPERDVYAVRAARAPEPALDSGRTILVCVDCVFIFN